MSCARKVVLPYLVSKLCPFDFFLQNSFMSHNGLLHEISRSRSCVARTITVAFCLIIVKKSCTHHSSVTVETKKECVSGHDDKSRTIMVAFHISFQSYGPKMVCVCVFFFFFLILCNMYSCTPQNSVAVRDIFTKFYSNVY